MKKTIHISTSFDHPVLLESMVEKLADRRYDVGYSHAEVPVDLVAVETSTTETYVSGTIKMECTGENINMPFITRFLFTCVKEKNDPYKMTWGTSLS